MLTSEDLKRIKKDPDSEGPLALLRIKELENSLTIALEINDKYQRENATLLKNRPLDTMAEVAYRELQAENEKLNRSVITQCTMCESQGEIDELEDKIYDVIPNLSPDRMH